MNLPKGWQDFAFWGLAGGAAVLFLEIWTTLRSLKGVAPAEYKRIVYWIGELLRILVGGLLAVALGGASQVTAPLGALTVGIATPLVIARLADSLKPFNPNP